MMRIGKLSALALIGLSLSLSAQAQVGGRSGSRFLRSTPTAFGTALGGAMPSTQDSGLAAAMMNPALARHMMGSLLLSYGPGPLGLQTGQALIGVPIRGQAVVFGLSYRSYGELEGRDASGNATGKVAAGDLALHAATSRRLGERWTGGVGATLHHRQLAEQWGLGLSVDAGAHYVDTNRGLSFGGVLRHVGVELKPFGNEGRRPLPLDVQLGISKRLARAPFRFTLTLHDLNRWPLRYSGPDDQYYEAQILGDTSTSKSSNLPDEILRHATGQVELLFGKSFVIWGSYNHQRRREMANPVRAGLAGFGGGFRLSARRYNVAYGYGAQNAAGGWHTLSVGFRVFRP